MVANMLQTMTMDDTRYEANKEKKRGDIGRLPASPAFEQYLVVARMFMYMYM